MYEREFGKTYDDAFSKRHRMDIYIRNKKRIEVLKKKNVYLLKKEHNMDHLQDRWGINRFTDEEDFELTNNYFMKVKGPEPELSTDVQGFVHHQRLN